MITSKATLVHTIDSLLDSIVSPQSVQELMQQPSKAGYVKAFYANSAAETPTETTSTPLNTGISIGGIGTAYAQTPAGSTPFISWCPGIFVTLAANDTIRMSNFFYSERAVGSHDIYIYDRDYFMNSAIHNPLLRPDGSWWFDGSEDMDTIHRRFQEMIHCETLYEDNAQELEKRGITLSPQTKSLVNSSDYKALHYNLILDVYCDSVVRPTLFSTSLTGNIEESTISEVNTYPIGEIQVSQLYPFVRTEYSSKDHSCSIKRYDWSPIVRKDEELTGLPINWSRFIIKNNSNEVREITLCQTQDNLTGAHLTKASSGGQDAHFYLQKTPKKQRNIVKETAEGLTLTLGADTQQGDLQGAISLGVQTDSTENVWFSATGEYYTNFEHYVTSEALNTGRLRPKTMRMLHFTGREQLNGALCATVQLAPGEKREITFTQCIDFPEIEIGTYRTRKQYDLFLPEQDYFKRAKMLLKRGMSEADEILSKVLNSSTELLKIIESKNLQAPDRKSLHHLVEMLCNQLSYFASSTVWDREGRVLIKECAEYPFFNSLDVYFYGSFALFTLMPQFDSAILREFSRAILREMPELQRYHYYRFYPQGPVLDPSDEGPRSVRGAVIHDLGCIFDMEQDSYYWRNPKSWKDLAPKFIMMVLRNYRLIGDISVVKDTAEAMKAAMKYLYDTFDPSMALPIVRNGIGDTFDEIGAYGITAYTATLWIAGLEAYCELMHMLDEKEEESHHREVLASARKDLEMMLWDVERGVYLFYTYPVEESHVCEVTPGLIEKLSQLNINQDTLISGLNQFIYSIDTTIIMENMEQIEKEFSTDGLSAENKKDRIILKKMFLKTLMPTLFNDSFSDIITKDADELFADQLLADTMCAILGLPSVTTQDRQESILTALLEHSEESQAGIRNVTCTEKGNICEQNQGEEVWIGVQFSLVSAFLRSNTPSRAFDLTENLYEILYKNIRIPFAFPEAVIQYGYITCGDLQALFDDDTQKTESVMDLLQNQLSYLDSAERISKPLTDELLKMIEKALQERSLSDDEVAETLTLIKTAQINYTVGHYLRPGMIFSLLYLPE